jgi:hypothetical protein
MQRVAYAVALRGAGRLICAGASRVARVFTATHAAVLLAAFLGAGYGLGGFLGKTLAFLCALDRSYWGDLGGVIGGWLGGVLWLGTILGMVGT